ncbi:vitamin K epoxide reductase family protein [Candidatus Parcubacteria bacterium]|nr:vitamin K epoxide reductase family protein [Candidatus Parcubacteria bacterium]
MKAGRAALLACLIVFSVIGLIDSWYLAESAATDAPLVCDIEGLDGCNTVAQSSYGKLFGIPLGFYGMAFYGALLILGIVGLSRRHHLVWFSLAALTGVGVIASLIFLFIQFALIGALCIYCLISAALTFAAFPLVLALKRDFNPHEEVVSS